MQQKERRNFPRVDIDYVTVEVYKSFSNNTITEIEEICSVINLSETGMKFRAEQCFVKDQLLHLTFVLPNSMVVIRAKSTVVYIFPTQDRNFFDIGVQFKNLGMAERKLIRHFVDKVLSQSSQH